MFESYFPRVWNFKLTVLSLLYKCCPMSSTCVVSGAESAFTLFFSFIPFITGFNLIMTSFSVVFFMFLRLELIEYFQTCGFIAFIRFGKFSARNPSSIFTFLFCLLSLRDSSFMCVRMLEDVPQFSD